MSGGDSTGGGSGRKLEGDQAPAFLGFLLSQMGIYASHRFAERIGALELHPGQFRVLNVIDAAEGESQHAIAEAIEVPASRMVALVDELEERGLVERRAHPTDRRVRALYLTPKGRKLLQRGRRIASDHEAALTKGLSEDDREKLIALLQKLASNQRVGAGVHPALSDPGGMKMLAGSHDPAEPKS